jgi:hypothetical protein
MRRKVMFWIALVYCVGGILWYCLGKHVERKRWEKATADVMWHCIEQHTGPAEPDPVVHPNTEEKTFFMVPTEETPVEEVSTH